MRIDTTTTIHIAHDDADYRVSHRGDTFRLTTVVVDHADKDCVLYGGKVQKNGSVTNGRYIGSGFPISVLPEPIRALLPSFLTQGYYGDTATAE